MLGKAFILKMHQPKPVDISSFKHLYPFESHFMQVNGFKYHYIDEGAGEPMVMIHGNPTWSFYFRNLIEHFSPRFRTIAMDHIGCGLSDKPPLSRYNYALQRRIHDLNTFLDSLALNQKLTLVVHVWGGVIGMAYALRHIDRIRRLIVLNTAAFFPPAGKTLPLRLRMIRNWHLFSTLSVLGLNLFARSALYMATRRNLTHDVKSGLVAPYNCWQNRIATLMFVRDIPLDSTDAGYHLVKEVDENLYKLSSVPMLICWGMRDFVFDADYLAEWQKRFPDAVVHAFENAGHYVLEDVPQKIIGCVQDFMQP